MDNTTISVIAANPWLTLVSFLIGVLGLVLAFVFYYKSQKDRRPFYEVASKTLIDGIDKTLDGLQIQYKGQPQNRITVTKIVFWNDGRETIDRNDLLRANPLRIVCPPDLEILDIQTILVSSVANIVDLDGPIKLDDSIDYTIVFEYLDHMDYFVIQVIHTGDDAQKFSIKGKIKGVAEIEQLDNFRNDQEIRKHMPPFHLLEEVGTSRLFQKYVGTFILLIPTGIGIWALTHGMKEWYVWTGTSIFLFAALGSYFGNRRLAPFSI